MGDAGGENPSEGKTTLFLQIVENPDGTIIRPPIPSSPPSGDDPESAVHCKDVPLNPVHGTRLRIYRPNISSAEKLPIILYFHGGGFVLFTAASNFYHAPCEAMAESLPALVISLDYRLAPEDRLPAAYDDAMEALLWVQAQARDPAAGDGDPWVTGHGDFTRFYLMGSSSGANMAYHVGIRTLGLDLEHMDIKLAGIVFNQPYFGGVERTPSELASEEDVILPLKANDMLWRLSLPKGADRNHEFCNPMAAAAALPPRLAGLPRCMVKGFHGDPLMDRQREFVKFLKGAGVNVVTHMDDTGIHAIELFDPVKAQALFDEIRVFIYTAI